MTDTQDNSSLPLLLSITGAVVVVAVGGWFLLGQDAPQADRPYEPPAVAAESPASPEVQTVAPADSDETAASGVDVALRKARLAADAELLIYPEDQSAFFYYAQVLAAEPYHAVASAELDAVLARVAVTVEQQMQAESYAEAYAIGQIVATLRPEHELVVDTQATLDKMSDDLVAEATRSARSGKDADAKRQLAEAAALPGRDAEYFDAVQASIDEIREVRVAAERDRANRARLAANEARSAWMKGVRAAIAAGNLVTPAGASALELLAEEQRWPKERAELESELLDALVLTATLHIETYAFELAESLLAAADAFPDEQAKFNELRASLEQAYITHESNKMKQVSELVAKKIVQPRYPRAAKSRSITGWVEVIFTVAPDGSTEQIEINRSEPENVFDNAAIQAVNHWEFEPVEYRGQFISQRAGARLVFAVE